MIRIIRSISDSLWLRFIQDLPGGIGFRLRHRYWRNRLKHLGQRSTIDCGVFFQGPEFISIGENTWIDRNVTIMAGRDDSTRKKKELRVKSLSKPGEVVVGDNVHIGLSSVISGIDAGVYVGNDCTFSSGVKVYAFSHHFRFDDDPGNRSCSFGSMVAADRQSMISGPVTLEENIGVALNAVILPGVFVGRDSFIGVGAVVKTGVYDENSMLQGSPAARTGPRFRS